MEIRQQEHEGTPSPTEIVDKFAETNQALLDKIWSVYGRPSQEGLIEFSALKEEALRQASVFNEQEFFREADNPLVPADAVRTMIDVLEELSPHVEGLSPGLRFHATFDDEEREEILETLLETQDHSDLVNDVDYEEDDEDYNETIYEYMTPAEQSAYLCNVYYELLSMMEQALKDCEPVKSFCQQKEQLAKRKDRIRNFGGIILAVGIGTKISQEVSINNLAQLTNWVTKVLNI